jgi:uncharacterized protein (TIGR03435 family)
MIAVAIAAITLMAATTPSQQSQPSPPSQTQTPQWQVAAGGKMSFEVASVKKSTPGQENYHSNFPLTLGSNFGSVGSLMSVNLPLRALVGFAFKLSAGQMHFQISGLPGWADSEWFDVEGRAPISTPSKDQFRLMIQSLLADRFKLAIHHEQRQLPIYELVLAKPGKAGPQLRTHVDDAECGAVGQPNAPPPPEDLKMLPCGSTIMGISQIAGHIKGGGRDVGLDYISAFLTGTGFQGVDADRLVVNRTGLTGNYDFWIDFAPPPGSPSAGSPDPNAPSFVEALRDELGLKMNATTGPVDVLIVDHIEEPSTN